MSPSFAEEVALSAAFALTNGRSQSAQAVSAALKRGWEAAQYGRVIPLPVLLDIWAVLETPRVGLHMLRALRPLPIEESLAYDDWVKDFCRRAPTYLGDQSVSHGTETHIRRPDYLPLFLDAWPANPVADTQLVHWADIYRTMQAEPSYSARIHAAWSGTRTIKLPLWKQWFPEKLERPHFSPAAGIWSNFAPDAYSARLHETFDHAAASLYLEAEDAPLLPDQQRRIQRLLQKRLYISVPLTTSYEEQDPHHGAITLITLCFEDYGDFQIVNGTAPRISNPPSSLPPRPFHIHLCWAHAYAGLAKAWPLQAFSGEGNTSRLMPRQARAHASMSMMTETSTLQGITALLLDDWRCALRRLPVYFHAHSGPPTQQVDALGKGGWRWKHAAKARGPVPSPQVVTKFFERRNWVNTGSEQLRWKRDRRPSEWWGLCLLKRDLMEFGFRLQETEDQLVVAQEARWLGDSAALPPCISHVIVIEPPDGVGHIYRVIRRHGGGGSLILHPIPRRQGGARESDPAYIGLRTHALDVVLEALETATQ